MVMETHDGRLKSNERIVECKRKSLPDCKIDRSNRDVKSVLATPSCWRKRRRPSDKRYHRDNRFVHP